MPERQTKKAAAEAEATKETPEATAEAAEAPAESAKVPAAAKEKKGKEERKGMADRVDQAFDLIREMTILELRDLNKRIEEEFGVAASAPMAMMAPAGVPAAGAPAAAAAPAEEEKTEWTVVLKDMGPNKVNVIKAVREVTPLGLKEAKDLVESAPTNVKEGVPKQEAEETRAKLADAGATVEIQ